MWERGKTCYIYQISHIESHRGNKEYEGKIKIKL